MKKNQRTSEYKADRIAVEKLKSGKMLMAYRLGQDDVFPKEWVARHYYGKLYSRATSRSGLMAQAKVHKLQLRWWKECEGFSVVGAIEDKDVIGYGIAGVQIQSGTMHILIKQGSKSYKRVLAAMEAKRFLRTK